MQNLKTIIAKHLKLEDAETVYQSLENIDDYVLISKAGLREIGTECYNEGFKSATPWSGHNPNHFDEFTIE